MKTCNICVRKHFAKGLCKSHYETRRIRKIREKRKKALFKELQKEFKKEPIVISRDAMWLRGFADGEGYVGKPQSWGGARAQRTISISNTEHCLIEKASYILDHIKIKYRITERLMVNRKPIEILYIGGQDNLLKWYQRIGFTSNRKKERLKMLIKEFEKKYLVNENKIKKVKNMFKVGYKMKEIGKKLNFTSYQVSKVLKKYVT